MRHASGTEEYEREGTNSVSTPKSESFSREDGSAGSLRTLRPETREESIFPASEPEPKEAPRDRGLNASTYQGLPMLVKQARMFPLVCSSHPDSTGVHETPDGHVICEQSRAMPGLPSRSDRDP